MQPQQGHARRGGPKNAPRGRSRNDERGREPELPRLRCGSWPPVRRRRGLQSDCRLHPPGGRGTHAAQPGRFTRRRSGARVSRSNGSVGLRGELRRRERRGAARDGRWPGLRANNTTAEVQVHPDGRFVYGSNRGHDSIVAFSINANTGALTLLGHTPTGSPRDAAADRWRSSRTRRGSASGQHGTRRVRRADRSARRVDAKHRLQGGPRRRALAITRPARASPAPVSPPDRPRAA